MPIDPDQWEEGDEISQYNIICDYFEDIYPKAATTREFLQELDLWDDFDELSTAEIIGQSILLRYYDSMLEGLVSEGTLECRIIEDEDKQEYYYRYSP